MRCLCEKFPFLRNCKRSIPNFEVCLPKKNIKRFILPGSEAMLEIVTLERDEFTSGGLLAENVGKLEQCILSNHRIFVDILVVSSRKEVLE